MSTRAPKRLTLTIPEAAEKLGIGRNQGYEAARSGQIPTLRIGKRWLVPLAAFEAKLADASVPQGKAKKAAAAR